MVFSSLTFLFLFLPVVLVLTAFGSVKSKNLLLFLASLFFYAWGEPVYLLLMLVSILLNYGAGLLIARPEAKPGTRKGVLTAAVSLNLLLLGVFKYADWFLESVSQLLNISVPKPCLALPIGISFYTFQALSYVIDVYRGTVGVQRNIITFGTYIALFPQLIAGPIVRYKTVENELSRRAVSAGEFASGIRRFVTGLAKKVLLANQIGLLWDRVSALPADSLPAATAWLGAAAFTFQIYFDFSGYSDMAIGLGRMLGFHFPENFHYPYLATSGTDFWRRWHISLGSWFREYVYIPLGGNRRGLPRQMLNLLIVWGLTGLWHGASWNFLCWGLYWGLVLVLEKTFPRKEPRKPPVFVRRIYTLFLIVIGWVVFALTDFRQMGAYLRAMFGRNGLADATSLYLLLGNLILLLALALGSTGLPARCGRAVASRLGNHAVLLTVIECVFILTLLFLSLAFLVGDGYNPFLYFRF